MGVNLEKYIADVDGIETGYDAFRFLRRIAAEYKLEKFSILGLAETVTKLSDTLVVNNWDPGLVQGYDEYNLAERSSVWERLNRSVVPYCWDIETLSKSRPPAEAKIANELFSDYGVDKGIFIPIHRSSAQPLAIGFTYGEHELSAPQIAELQFLALYAGENLNSEIISKGLPPCSLSPREKECLKWTANGKTSSETGKILSISEHTVNHHLYGAMQKLDAANRIHAVAIAIRQGLFRS
ncbi:MAG: LuxR C-terminal-related transcriptional regulator [Hyphomicrobiales bacterium]